MTSLRMQMPGATATDHPRTRRCPMRPVVRSKLTQLQRWILRRNTSWLPRCKSEGSCLLAACLQLVRRQRLLLAGEQVPGKILF